MEWAEVGRHVLIPDWVLKPWCANVLMPSPCQNVPTFLDKSDAWWQIV